MRWMTVVGPAVLMMAVLALARPAHAERVSRMTPDMVEGACNESGGQYYKPNGNGVYGCLNDDGSGTVCGGTTASDKNSCDKWGPGLKILPTRAQVRAALRNITPIKK